VAYIVQQRSKSDVSPFLSAKAETPSHSPGNMHHAEGVVEPRVNGSGVNEICHGQLVDIPQALHDAAVYDALF